MANKMKVKNVLKMVNSVKISIRVQNDPASSQKHKTYYIDYYSEKDGISYNGDTRMECSCINYIPDYVLDRRVTFISASQNSVIIGCYEKEE